MDAPKNGLAFALLHIRNSPELFLLLGFCFSPFHHRYFPERSAKQIEEVTSRVSQCQGAPHPEV